MEAANLPPFLYLEMRKIADICVVLRPYKEPNRENGEIADNSYIVQIDANNY